MYGQESKIKIGRRVYRVRYHRNGVAGEGFSTVRWRENKRDMLATVFQTDGYIAVIDLAAPSFSWRGNDTWGKTLRQAIELADHRWWREQTA